MNNVDMEKLKTAQKILHEAYVHFIRAYDYETEFINAKKKRRRHIIIGIIVWLVIIGMTASGGILNFLIKLVGTAALIAFILSEYKKPKEFEEKIEPEEKAGSDFLAQNEDQLQVVPPRYRYPIAVDYIIEMLETGRAENMNKALDMCDEYIHRLEMKEANEAGYEELKREQAGLDSAASIAAAAAIMHNVIGKD